MARPESPECDPGKIFVGGLSWSTEDGSMRRYFERYGEITDCIVMKNPNQDPTLKKNKGFGFVTFKDPKTVDMVLRDRNHILDDKRIDPKKALKNSGGKDTDKKVFIGGLARHTEKEDVEEYFNSHYGGVVEVVLKFDEAQQKRGFGFVVFESTEYVTEVLKTQYHDIGGKKVEVKKAEPRWSTDSAMRNTNHYSTLSYPPHFPPPHGEYQGANGHHQYAQWGGPNPQYYNPPYPPPPPAGYGHQTYSTGAGYHYDHSGYGRTQTSTGERPDQQTFYQTQPGYGQQQGAAGTAGYSHEAAGYGAHTAARGGYPSGQGGAGYAHPVGSYGRGGHHHQQQQRYPYGQ